MASQPIRTTITVVSRFSLFGFWRNAAHLFFQLVSRLSCGYGFRAPLAAARGPRMTPEGILRHPVNLLPVVLVRVCGRSSNHRTSDLRRLRLNLLARHYWMPRRKPHEAGHDNRDVEHDKPVGAKRSQRSY